MRKGRIPSDLPFLINTQFTKSHHAVYLSTIQDRRVDTFARYYGLTKERATDQLLEWGWRYWNSHRVELYMKRFPRATVAELRRHFNPDWQPI